MQTLSSGYRSLSFLFNLNWDRILFAFTILFALWIASLMSAF